MKQLWWIKIVNFRLNEVVRIFLLVIILHVGWPKNFKCVWFLSTFQVQKVRPQQPAQPALIYKYINIFIMAYMNEACLFILAYVSNAVVKCFIKMCDTKRWKKETTKSFKGLNYSLALKQWAYGVLSVSNFLCIVTMSARHFVSLTKKVNSGLYSVSPKACLYSVTCSSSYFFSFRFFLLPRVLIGCF